jgi:hypothetical protein
VILDSFTQWSCFVDTASKSQPIEDSVRSMHRLTHLATKFWLTKQDKQAEWEAKALQLIHDKFEQCLTDHASNGCRLLISHALTAITFKYGNKDLAQDLQKQVEKFKQNEREELRRNWHFQPNSIEEGLRARISRGTCQWFLNSPEYHGWLKGEPFLLCLGGSWGSGKLVLSWYILHRHI